MTLNPTLTRIAGAATLMSISLTSSALQAQQEPASAPTARLVEEMRIDGTREGFAGLNMNSIRAGTAKQTLLFEPLERRVRLFDSSGGPTLTFGRDGDGPGEFRATAAARVGWLADTIWVYDPTLARITFLTRDGVLRSTTNLRQFPPQPPAGSPLVAASFTPTAVIPGGSVLGTFLSRDQSTAAGSRWYALWARTGETSLLQIRAPASGDQWVVASLGASGRMSAMTIPFKAADMESVSADGSILAVLTTDQSASTYAMVQLTVRRTNGESIYTQSLRYPGVPVPVDSLRGVLRRENNELSDAAMDQLPRVKPVVTRMVVGMDATVWLEYGQVTGGTHSLMLDRSGRPAYNVIIPRGGRILDSNDGAIWVLERDADNIPSVVRYALRP